MMGSLVLVLGRTSFVEQIASYWTLIHTWHSAVDQMTIRSQLALVQTLEEFGQSKLAKPGDQASTRGKVSSKT